MILTIDLESDRPLYLQIVDAVQRALVEGQLEPGDALPAGRQLAEALGVNLETVQRAYRRLSEESIVTSRVGRGTRISATVDVAGLGIGRIVEELASEAKRLDLSLDQVLALVEARLKLSL